MSLLLSALLAALALAQQSPAKPGSCDNGAVLGSQLIDWSILQQPQPLAQEPRPLPPPADRSGAQPDPKVQPPHKTQPRDATKAAPDSVTGTILKVGNKFVLRTAAAANYQLDDQDKAKVFAGKRVKVLGTLDPASNVIYVSSIELVS